MGDMTEATKEVIEALKPLADKLGTGADQYYKLAIRQVYIDSFESLLWIAFFVFFLPKFYGWAKNKDNDDMLRAASGLLFFVSLALIFVCVECSMSGFLNPDYQAVSNILGKLIVQPK